MGELEKRSFIAIDRQCEFAQKSVRMTDIKEMRREFPLDLEWIPLIEELLKNAEA